MVEVGLETGSEDIEGRGSECGYEASGSDLRQGGLAKIRQSSQDARWCSRKTHAPAMKCESGLSAAKTLLLDPGSGKGECVGGSKDTSARGSSARKFSMAAILGGCGKKWEEASP